MRGFHSGDSRLSSRRRFTSALAPRQPESPLVTGDLHLGRRSARLPAALANDRRGSAVAAWERVVQLALDRRVEAVVLTGDVVDRENRYYEAVGPLAAGISRLAAAGIDTVAVAGNHDFDVLPRLARVLGEPRFRVLGAGGSWQRAALERDGRPVLCFDGWSFPDLAFSTDPLDSYSPAPCDTPVLGVVHGEVGVVASRYAPLAVPRLRAAPVAAWLLGHIHRAGPIPGAGSARALPRLAAGPRCRRRGGPRRLDHRGGRGAGPSPGASSPSPRCATRT